MANKYEKVEWEDRQSQYPNRRKMIPTEIENVYEVERAEGEVTEPGNAFDATNMNGLEDRVYSAFDTLDSSDIQVLDKGNHFVATDLEGVLGELFTSASNGKSAIATAIGSPASNSDSFAQLASKITAQKNGYESSIQKLNNNVNDLKNEINTGKTALVDAIGGTRNGTPSVSESFGQMANRVKKDKVSFDVFQIDIPAKHLNAGEIWSQNYSHSFGFVPYTMVGLYLNVDYYEKDGPFIWRNNTYGLLKKDIRIGNLINCGIANINASGFTVFCTAGSYMDWIETKAGSMYIYAYA